MVGFLICTAFSNKQMEPEEGAKSSHKSHKAQKADLVKHSDHSQDSMQQVNYSKRGLQLMGCSYLKFFTDDESIWDLNLYMD